MTGALTAETEKGLSRVLKELVDECEASGAIVCDIGGNILAQDLRDSERPLGNAAALAAASFAATRELANVIGEPGFRSIFHRGKTSGVLIQALSEERIILVILGERSIEGLVRLLLRKACRQMSSILDEGDGEAADVDVGPIEVEEKPETDT